MDTAEPAGVPLTGEERAELTWLRAENELLRVQRDMLTRIATGYARDVEVILGRRAGAGAASEPPRVPAADTAPPGTAPPGAVPPGTAPPGTAGGPPRR
ncbi:hypothetical protein [Saccharothrix algeriensis]|uniref:Uncharacterized protein n=1 Tax=Saccharothrix algeriensis TaxID=173560 RepID=A0A8T8I7I4_9PSEU|nr:hypothetical protein [Saccharothrix algeriensis]MBM7809894.1 hypothetical protein [Saccharothrix algeriensis]QTR06548.1 hypothetical protein J7S33_04015 [Saccharothrix algeriensis]